MRIESKKTAIQKKSGTKKVKPGAGLVISKAPIIPKKPVSTKTYKRD